MKPTSTTLFKLLASLASAATLAHADYNGGQILNQADPGNQAPLHTGHIIIDYANPDLDLPAGAVQWTESGTTSLEGNIAITTTSTSENPEAGAYALYIHDDVENAAINLKANNGNRITLTGIGRGGGIRNISETSTINLESDSLIEINSTNSGGITTRGTINIIGDILVNTTNSTGITANRPDENTAGALITVSGTFKANITYSNSSLSVPYGIDSHGIGTKILLGSSADIDITGDISSTIYGLQATKSGRITIAGPTSITTRGSGTANGITSATDAAITINDTLKIKIDNTGTNNQALRARDGGTITLNGQTDIEFTNGYGIYATNGTVIANCAISISSTAAARGIVASNGGTILLSGGTINAANGTAIIGNAGTATALNRIADTGGIAHHYTIIGGIEAREYSIIDLKLNSASRLTGHTYFQNQGIGSSINLQLSDQSLWHVTADSTLTTLTLDGTSWLAFNLLDSGAMTFANITAASIALADGAVLQLLGVNSADFDTMGRALTTFTANLLNAGALTANDIKLVTADNYELTYTDNGDGTFTVTGVTANQLFIPEPATATLGLFGLASFILRRRKS